MHVEGNFRAYYNGNRLPQAPIKEIPKVQRGNPECEKGIKTHQNEGATVIVNVRETQ